MPDKYPWQKWCNICEEWVDNKKLHYIEYHPDFIWHRMKRIKAKYYDEIKECHEDDDLTILIDLVWVLVFRVPMGVEEDFRLEDGRKIKVGTFYNVHDDDGYWKPKDWDDEEEEEEELEE